jgi:hypothetical protein
MSSRTVETQALKGKARQYFNTSCEPSAKMHMYAVVSGTDWDDIVYFSDLLHAKRHLVSQAIPAMQHPREFCIPFMLWYKDVSGIFAREDIEMHVDVNVLRDMTTLYTLPRLRTNPTLAFAAIINTKESASSVLSS